MIPSHDSDFLSARYPNFKIEVVDGMICVVVSAYPLGPGYTEPAADLLLRLNPGYPDAAPDMWWFSPAVARLDGRPIAATEVTEQYFETTWQRWSRHLQPGQWRPGSDGLESYLALVRRELINAAAQIAA